MKLSCNVIRDLIPLYADQICSEESKELVEEHLTDCKDCSVILQQMCNDEVESRLETETVNVLRRQASFFKQKSAVIGHRCGPGLVFYCTGFSDHGGIPDCCAAYDAGS